MGGFMDILLSLVKVLCGSSTTQEEPTEYQKPEVLTQWPQPITPPQLPSRPKQEWKPVSHSKPLPEVPTARPHIPPQHRPEQEPKPVSYPPLHRPRQEQKSKPVSHHRHEVPTERPQIPPQQRLKQERKPASHPKPEVPTERPQIPPQYHPEQELKPVSYPPSAHRPRQDQNQINQDDDHYVALRAKANEHGDLMARSFQESHEAYSRGDRALAKQLSEKGKQHERTMESLNAEASAWIFRRKNMDSKPGEIDLHGLYVKEAVSYADKGIQEARQRGDAEIRLIVGKGLHSDRNVAKIKPAIEDLMKKNNIPTEVDPHNGGVLIAQLR